MKDSLLRYFYFLSRRYHLCTPCPIIKREVVERFAWLSDEEFVDTRR